MKEKLSQALGTAGVILFYIVAFTYAFAPLYVLDFPFLVDILLIFVILNTNLIGGIACFVLYVMAFIRVFSQPFSIASVIFLVCAVVYFFFSVVPTIQLLFSRSDD